MDKLIITVSLTGGFHGKEANPNLPEQPSEIIQAAYDCYNAGAAIAHIHARDPQGRPTGDPEIYREIIAGVRAKCNMITQTTTGGAPGMSVEERMRSLESRPEMASLNMGTAVADWKGQENVFSNTKTDIRYAAKKMLDYGIKPEMEVYNEAMLHNVEDLIDQDLLKKPYYINFVLNMTKAMQGTVKYSHKTLMFLIDQLPAGSIYNVTGIGSSQLPATTLSLLLGGNLRVGFEDNVFYSKGVLANSNAQLVERAVRIARELQREIATPDEAREMLGLKA
ncbi:MAG: 3-keto-5-aminohexanoate cleavage enzyme [Pelotomaculum sp. PtaU1.Bin035]|nr:MAG: 3-keto-5-aminohexanoate cleavage enzyme [Pelotomaculum sp. PtaU1.Bin035]